MILRMEVVAKPLRDQKVAISKSSNIVLPKASTLLYNTRSYGTNNLT